MKNKKGSRLRIDKLGRGRGGGRRVGGRVGGTPALSGQTDSSLKPKLFK